MKIEQKTKISLDSEDVFALNKTKNLLEQLCDKNIFVGNAITSTINCFGGAYDEEDFSRAMDVIGVVLQIAEDKEKKSPKDLLIEKKLQTFENMIDTRCDMDGIPSTLDYLVEQEYTESELLSMMFDIKDIKEAFARAEKE